MRISPTLVAAMTATLFFGCSSGSTHQTPSDMDAIDEGESNGDMQADASSDPTETERDGGMAATDPDASGEPARPIPLPEGSREHEGIVNLVDEKAAAQLQAFFLSQTPTHVALRREMTESVNVFLEHYLDEYDFLYFFPGHTIEGTGLAGKFEAVTRPAEPGGGDEIEIQASDYKTNGRLKAAMGIMYAPNFYGPLGHETMHYWGNHLDTELGFGRALRAEYGPHWGLTGVNGQLGGFDPATLRCETPKDALPPACTALPSGRVRYIVKHFYPNSNASLPYSPLERYLMGLIPQGEVPSSLRQIEAGEIVADSFDAATGTVVLEGSGIRDLPLSEIVARHGTKRLLSKDERHFRAAFVVISAAPATDEVMADVARWSAVFGNRTQVPGLPSFERLTDGLATMDTRLGARRMTSQPVAAPRKTLTCSVLAQDCPRPELGCFWFEPSVCALSGGVALDQPCNSIYACAPGLECLRGPSSPDSYFCRPYCAADEPASNLSCAALCPGQFETVSNSKQELVGAYCLPD